MSDRVSVIVSVIVSGRVSVSDRVSASDLASVSECTCGFVCHVYLWCILILYPLCGFVLGAIFYRGIHQPLIVDPLLSGRSRK